MRLKCIENKIYIEEGLFRKADSVTLPLTIGNQYLVEYYPPTYGHGPKILVFSDAGWETFQDCSPSLAAWNVLQLFEPA